MRIPYAFSPISAQIVAGRQQAAKPARRVDDRLADIGGRLACWLVAAVCLYMVCVAGQRVANGQANVAAYAPISHVDCAPPSQWFIDRCVTSTGFAHLRGK